MNNEKVVDGKEVSELQILSNRLQKLKDKGYYNPDEIATCLISEGYSKQPAQQSSPRTLSVDDIAKELAEALKLVMCQLQHDSDTADLTGAFQNGKKALSKYKESVK